ncbi:MAG: glucose-6-phosphate dehydrogenase [Campylobacterales bacterium]|nr:glucose-6-phosphate dehydrogenase [Campylobacterales bacterium]
MNNQLSKQCDIIIFGGYGDLAFRKLIPALYHLRLFGYLDQKSRIISIARDNFTKEQHIQLTYKKLNEFLVIDKFDPKFFEEFKLMLDVCKIDFNDTDSFNNLKTLLQTQEDHERVYYLSTASDFFGTISESLSNFGLINEKCRIVLEKPLGRDFESSMTINNQVLNYFNEDQIFRIDHYLGKDTVQNILALRFSNRIFMPLWGSRDIDHVQITVAESVGVEGRWGYYDQYGALRDMIQNHLMQLLCLVAMEPPCSLDANRVRDEKVKVLRSIRKMSASDIATKTVRAQYTKGVCEGKEVPGYREGEGVANSTTETFAAMRVDIDNWRWNGVPFYIRSGKRMREKNSEIVIQFKSIPHSIFPNEGRCISENKLVISLQPNESIKLKMMNKVPGITKEMNLQEVALELNASNSNVRKPEAYERLLLDVIQNNPTLFMRLDEVQEAWKWADEIIKAWGNNSTPMKTYSAGSDGPSAAVQMIAQDGRSWNDE